VLDLTDHVWVEVKLNDSVLTSEAEDNEEDKSNESYFHVDICEGAINNPLMYERDWGKKLTRIFAFGLGPPSSSSGVMSLLTPLVEDVSFKYKLQHERPLIEKCEKMRISKNGEELNPADDRVSIASLAGEDQVIIVDDDDPRRIFKDAQDHDLSDFEVCRLIHGFNAVKEKLFL
jgi:hypothetical protein